MDVNTLKDLRIKLDNIEDFKKIVQEAIDGECLWKHHGFWLSEEYYEDHGTKIYDVNFRAVILCVNDTHRDTNDCFVYNHRKVTFVTAYDIFYCCFSEDGIGGFVVSDVNLSYDALQSIKGLKSK